MAFLNLSTTEIVIVVVVAIVVFGRRLPEVAGQAAGAVQRMRRSLDDLRRETGIDREIRAARRAVEEAVPREVRTLDVRRTARATIEQALGGEAEVQPGAPRPIPPAQRDAPSLPAADASGALATTTSAPTGLEAAQPAAAAEPAPPAPAAQPSDP
jgi:Sec-independent protein translocase protein TatA